ncbi:hypothetical protein BH23ACT5_BH23ACT5_13920 [soil metagenome]
MALADIFILWLLVGAIVVAFWQVSRPAAFLLVPYWLWVTFAGALNFEIWRLNS